MASSRSGSLFGLCLFVAACAPTTATCPDGFMLNGDGRCIAATDGGPPHDAQIDGGGVDADLTHDSGVAPDDTGTMVDAFVALDAFVAPDAVVLPDAYVPPDACAFATFYRDVDGDGFGDGTMSMQACSPPAGYVAMATDCNDSCPSCHPGMTELCDGVDNDCNGAADNGFACVQGATGISCTAACGSTSTTTCTATCALAACAAPAETCNGTDDDCDGRADEGLGSVGAGVCAGLCTVSAPTRVSPHIVALAGATYGVVFTSSTQDQFYFQNLAADGTATGSVLPIGTAAHPIALGPATFEAAFDGTNVIVLYTHQASGDNNAYLLGFAPATGGIAFNYALTPPSGRDSNYRVRLASVSSGRATAYVEQVNSTMTRFVRRYRLNTAGTVFSAIYQVDVTTTLGAVSAGGAWDALATGSGEVVVFRDSSNNLVLARGPIGDATTGTFMVVGNLQTAAQQPNVTTVALAVRDVTASVSAANPLGVAWQRDSGNGTFVAQLTSTASATLTTPQLLAGSHGAPQVLGVPHWLVMFALPDVSTYMNNGLFYVVSVEDDTTSSSNFVGALAAWEVTPGGVMPRSMTVPTETSGSRFDVSVATNGTGIRIAEQNTMGGLVTRSLGCR